METIRFDGVVGEFYDGGFTIAKGFLRLEQVINFKIYDKLNDTDFQRPAEKKHVENLVNYLTHKPYKILPDIIFSIKNDYEDCTINGTAYKKNNVFLWSYEIVDARYKAQNENGLKNIAIWFAEDAFKYIDTIDGNHRLAALKKIFEKEKDSIANLKNFKIPVTFILNNTVEKEKAFFYYLNGKSKPLLPHHYINLLKNNGYQELKQIDNELEIYKRIHDILTDEMNKTSNRSKDNTEKIEYGLLKVAHELTRSTINDEFIYLILNQLSEIIGCVLENFEKTDELINILFISIRIYLDEIEKNKEKFQEIVQLLDGNYEQLKPVIGQNIQNEEDNYKLIRDTVTKIEKEITGLREWKYKQKIDFSDMSDEPFEDIVAYYKAYQIYKKTFTPSSRKIFIAMPFDKKLEATYLTIKNVILELNRDDSFIYDDLQLIRIDKEVYPTSEFINENIMDEINNAALMIADLTGHNRNVYYELGYKAGIDRALNKRRIIVIQDTANLYSDDDRKNENERLMDLQNKVITNIGQDTSIQHIKVKVKELNSLETAFDIYTLAQIQFKDYDYLKAKLNAKLRKYYTEFEK